MAITGEHGLRQQRRGSRLPPTRRFRGGAFAASASSPREETRSGGAGGGGVGDRELGTPRSAAMGVEGIQGGTADRAEGVCQGETRLCWGKMWIYVGKIQIQGKIWTR